MEQLTPIQRIAYETVAGITRAKDGANDPCMALMDEIRSALYAELTGALRELCREGVLAVSLDINKNPMFSIKRRL